MVAQIETPFGHALPPASPHSVTMNAPGWTTIEKFVAGDPETISRMKSTYPRFGPFNRTKALIGTVVPKLKEGQMCLLFPNQDSARACKVFMCSPERKDEVADAGDVSIKAFDFHVRVYATVFPACKINAAIPFWQDPGTAVSTRLAEDCLKHADQIKEAELDSEAPEAPAAPAAPTSAAYETLQNRIVELVERAPSSPHSKKVAPDDVYLFQTGMASIYLPHMYLSAARPGTTILYGFAFHSTPHIFERFGANTSSFKWFGRGADGELEALESFAEAEHAAGRKVQALWAEFPTNPNLTTPNLSKLRAIADKYSFPVIIDDTVASFANVDVLGDSGADVIMSSLTKSFSGYADVMGGSIVLNPASKHYKELKDIFNKHYTNDLYFADAEALEKNSRNYFERTIILNRNAQAVVTYLSRPEFAHAVDKIYYPTTQPASKANYDVYLRAPSKELPSPGYGCLLSIEFKTLEQSIAFYDNIPTHCGPHLGAHLTIALPYTKLLIMQAKSDDIVVKKGGLSEQMIRISVGLEDEQDLLEKFKYAMQKCDEITKKNVASGNAASVNALDEAADMAVATVA